MAGSDGLIERPVGCGLRCAECLRMALDCQGMLGRCVAGWWPLNGGFLNPDAAAGFDYCVVFSPNRGVRIVCALLSE